MFQSKISRIIGVVLLLILLFALFVWHGSLPPNPEKGRYIGQKELLEEYENHVGKKVQISGDVIDTDPLVIRIRWARETMELIITGTNKEIALGDRLSVFGRVEENHEIKADNVVVRAFWRPLYLYGISSLAAVWVTIRTVKEWRFNRKNWEFEPREEPLDFTEILVRWKGSDDIG